MIYSTDFATGIGSWNQYGAAVLSYDQSLQALSFQTFSEEWAGAYNDIGSVPDGTLLVLRVRVRAGSSGAGKFVRAAIKEETDTTIDYSIPVKLSENEWSEIWVTHVVSGTQNITIHVAGFDYTNGIFYIDNAELDTYVLPVMTVSGRQILKDGVAFKTRGINYTNDPIAGLESTSFAAEQKQVRYDALDLAAAGFNCIRTYQGGILSDGVTPITPSQIKACLDEFWRNGIYVMLNHWVLYDTDYSVATGGANRTDVIDDFEATVQLYQDHPAVLFFSLGNEVNYHFGATPESDFYTMIEAALTNAKLSCDRTLYTCVTGEVSTIFNSGNANAPAVDFWSSNIYRGRTFSTLRAQLTTSLTKPFLFAEYGFDRYNNRIPAEDPYGQAFRDLSLMKEMEAAYPIYAGGFIFASSDQWWRTAPPTVHNNGGVVFNDDRDNMVDEEWWGLRQAAAIDHAASGEWNQVYYMLKEFMARRAYGATGYRESTYNAGLRRLKLRDMAKSLSFNGSSSLATCPLVPSTTSFNFAMWVKINRFTANDRIIDYGDAGPSGGFLLSIHTSAGYPRLVMQVYSGASPAATLFSQQIPLGKYFHVAGTIATNNVKLYVNGFLRDYDNNSGMTAPTQTLTIGRRSNGATNFGKIEVDEIVLKNGTVWTQAEIDALISDGVLPAGSSCYINCNDNVTDQTGNGNNLTASNTAYSTDVPVRARTPSTVRLPSGARLSA